MRSGTPLRLVLDTNVCLDLFVFGDPQCASLLAAVHAGEVELVTRDDCRDEWLAVLAYPQLKLGEELRLRVVELFDAHVRRLSLPPCDVTLPRCRDRDDQKFLELALQARAAALLTRDDELLRLAKRTKRDGLFAILMPAVWREAMGL